jgi:hypothetical protein
MQWIFRSRMLTVFLSPDGWSFDAVRLRFIHPAGMLVYGAPMKHCWCGREAKFGETCGLHLAKTDPRKIKAMEARRIGRLKGKKQ